MGKEQKYKKIAELLLARLMVLQKEFNNIVVELAKRYPGIKLTEEELMAKANMWEMSHGGVSGRTAQQFINYLAGKGE